MKAKSKNKIISNTSKIKKDIGEMLAEDFFPKSSKEFLYSKLVPGYNQFFKKYSNYALSKTKEAMSYMIDHEKLYLIGPDEFFPKLYEILKEHYRVYISNVNKKERSSRPEKEDVDSVFEDFAGSFRD